MEIFFWGIKKSCLYYPNELCVWILPGEVVEEADLYQRNVVDGSSVGLNCITSLVHTVIVVDSKIAAKHHGGSCVLELFLAPRLDTIQKES
jgi:hypothetical protein